MTRHNFVTKSIMGVVIIITILTQIEILAPTLRPVMYVLWISLSIILIIETKGRFAVSYDTRMFVISYLVYIAFCFICSFFNPSHLENRYISVLVIPLMISLIVELCSNEIANDLQFYIKCYVFASVILAIYIRLNYVSSYTTWLTANQYIYEEKNSAAQIWISSILLIVFLLEKTKVNRFIWYAISIYLLIVVGLCQCRTALLALLLGLAILVLFRSKRKLLWVILIVSAIFLLWNIPLTNQYISQAIMLSRYNSTDLNSFSSGRIVAYQKSIEAFLRAPIIGNGKWYVDCSYLFILAESGIIGFIIIVPIWIRKIVSNIQLGMNTNCENNISNFLLVVTVYYIIESLLEGFPPFGPGVCAFGFWFFTGLIGKRITQNLV